MFKRLTCDSLWQMEISRYLRQHARTIAGKSQLFINSYAKALEVDVIVIYFTMHVCVLCSHIHFKIEQGYGRK